MLLSAKKENTQCWNRPTSRSRKTTPRPIRHNNQKQRKNSTKRRKTIHRKPRRTALSSSSSFPLTAYRNTAKSYTTNNQPRMRVLVQLLLSRRMFGRKFRMRSPKASSKNSNSSTRNSAQYNSHSTTTPSASIKIEPSKSAKKSKNATSR